MSRRSGIALACALLLSCAAFANDELPADEDAVLVRANCSGCHSLKLVTQQCATAEEWTRMIRWMQKKHNLWALAPEMEAKIVAYLTRHFGPRREQRRAPLPTDQMPPNPYAKTP